MLSRNQGPALPAAAALSGAAALVYELIWIRRLGDVLGNSTYAVQIVLAVFFGGLGIGAWLGGRAADRIASARGTLRLYVALELAIGLWGFLFWPAVDGVEVLCARLSPTEWAAGEALLAKGLAAALVLAPPTLAMGASLPALLRCAVHTEEDVTGRLAALYGWNTVGAASGVALAMAWWIPTLGLFGSAAAAAGLNVAACTLAASTRAAPGARVSGEARPPAGAPDPLDARGDRLVLWVAALLSGFVSVGLEVLWTRALAARFLSTVYSFATILFVFLLCLGTGALYLRRLERRHGLGRSTVATVTLAAGLSGLVSLAVLARMPSPDLAAAAGRGWAALQWKEFWQALFVMAVPAWLFGLSFPLLARLLHRSISSVGSELGRLYLANTIGSVAAPLVLAFLVLPVLGLKATLAGCALVAVLFGLLVLLPWARVDEGRRRGWYAASLGIGAAALFLAGDDIRLWSEGRGDVLLYYRDGPAAAVAVVQTADGNRVLKIDNHYRLGATRNRFAQERQALVPIQLAGEPRAILALGMATGSSAGAAAAFGAESVDVLEIVPGLGALLPFFADANLGLAERITSDPDVRLLEVDGRHFIRGTDRRYDLVLGDLFVPWRVGEGGMYTREHFEAVRGVLRPGGAFCQWLPLYQLRPADLAVIVRTFVTVFPEVEAFWLYFNAEQPVIGLVGSLVPLPAPIPVAARSERQRALFERAGLVDQLEVAGSWIAGGERLRAWSASAALETQDRPRIEFRAPAHRFESSRPPAAENLEALRSLAAPFDDVGPFQGDAAARAEVAALRRAVAHFFRAEELRLYAGRAADAVDELRLALEATPEWSWIAWNLEQTVRRHIDTEPALAMTAARTLARSAGFAAQGHYLVACVLRAGGERTEARRLVDRALELDPEHAPSRALLAELQAQGGG